MCRNALTEGFCIHFHFQVLPVLNTLSSVYFLASPYNLKRKTIIRLYLSCLCFALLFGKKGENRLAACFTDLRIKSAVWVDGSQLTKKKKKKKIPFITLP